MSAQKVKTNTYSRQKPSNVKSSAFVNVLWALLISGAMAFNSFNKRPIGRMNGIGSDGHSPLGFFWLSWNWLGSENCAGVANEDYLIKAPGSLRRGQGIGAIQNRRFRFSFSFLLRLVSSIEFHRRENEKLKIRITFFHSVASMKLVFATSNPLKLKPYT